MPFGQGSQKFAGDGRLAALAVIMTDAEGIIVRVPPPGQRRWVKGCRPGHLGAKGERGFKG